MTVLEHLAETQKQAQKQTQAQPPEPTPRSGPGAGRWLWVMVIVAAVAFLAQSILMPLKADHPALAGVSTAMALVWQILSMAFAFWHGGRCYGARGIILLFVITFVISNAYENLSISTGFPFGHYHYTHDGTPFLFQVPVTIGLAYFGYGYLSWCVASAILGFGLRGAAERSWFTTVLQPVTAAFVMVMWDLVMDPLNSTIGHTWIWHDGGGYNGVPLTNYLGWFLTVWTVYQVFALILHARPTLERAQPALGFWVMPTLLYVLTALSYVIGYLFVSNRTIVDATGRSWSSAGINETSVTVMLFTMLFASYLAFVSLAKESRARRSAG